MVFNSELTRGAEDDQDEVTPEEVSDGQSASKPNKVAPSEWHVIRNKPSMQSNSIDASDDEFAREFENLRARHPRPSDQSTSQAHNYFSEREGREKHVGEDLDLFNLKSLDSGEVLFDVKSSDSEDSDASVSGTETSSAAGVDLLNVGEGDQAALPEGSTKGAVKATATDDLGVDLLNLSPTGSGDSHNVDLFSGTEKSCKGMRRNKSAEDVLSPKLHDEDDFFELLGSRSSSSSRENVTSFPTSDVTSTGFDPFGPTRTKSPDMSASFYSNTGRRKSPDLFESFGPKKGSDPLAVEFDPFVAKPAGNREENSFDQFGSGAVQNTSKPFHPFASQGSGDLSGTFDPFTTTGYGTGTNNDLFGESGSQSSMATSQAEPNVNADLFRGWGNTATTPLKPNKVPSPTPLRKPPPSLEQTNKRTSNDPFSDFGDLTANLPKSSSASRFPTGIPSSPKTRVGPGTSTNSSWSRPAQQTSWQYGAKPAVPPSMQRKPNYTPPYSSTSGSGVFGNYGQKWSGEWGIIQFDLVPRFALSKPRSALQITRWDG